MTTVTYAVINTGTNLKREQCLEKYHEIEEIAKHIIAELDKTDGENSEFVEKCKVLRTHLADINSDYSECFNYKDGLPYAKFEDLINDSLKKSTHYDKCLTWNLESASKDKAEDQKEKSPEQEEGNEKDINPPRETIQAQSQCSGNYCETEHQSGHGLEGEKQMRSGVSGPAHEETHLDSPSKITDAHGAEPTLSSTSRGESDTYSSPGADATTLKGVRAANQPQIGGRGDSQNDSSQYDTSKGEIGNTELHTLTNEVTDALLPGTLSGHPSTDEQVAGENHGTLARGMPPKNMPSLGVPGITDGHSHVRSTPDSEQVSNADSGVNGRGIVLQNPDLPTTVPESWIYSFKMYIIIGVSILAVLLLISLIIRFTSLGRLFRRKKKKKREDMEEEFKEMLLDSLNQREENIYVSYECLNR